MLHYGATRAPAVDVLLGDGRGRFAAPIVTPASNIATMEVGDVDADGHADVLIGDGLDKGVRVLFGRADGGLTTGALAPTTIFATSLALADLDADTALDAVARLPARRRDRRARCPRPHPTAQAGAERPCPG